MAESVPGIDVIIGGHDHKAITPPGSVNNCLVVQAGEHGKFLGKLDIEVDELSGRILRYSGELIPITENMEQDQETIAAIASEKERADRLTSQLVGRVEVPVDLAFDRECAAGNLLADALIKRFEDAQFSFVLVGQWTTGLPAGDITAGMLFSANRSSANPTRTELTGSQVIDFLKNALTAENPRRELHSLRGGKVGWPHVSGLELSWDGQDVETLQAIYRGQPLQADQKYVVVATDMEFSDFMGYLAIPDEAVHYEVPTIMPEVLLDFIRDNSPIQEIATGRIQTVK
jgi:5'-nucleotidase